VDAVRYYLGLIVLLTGIPALVFWLLAHGMIRTWRRLGAALSYTLLFILMAALGFAVYLVRAPLMASDFGTNRWLFAPALVFYAASAVIEIQTRKQLALGVLVGLPELAPSRDNQKLLHEGIYARLRHPRYLSFILGLLGVTLFVNNLALYLFYPIFVLLVYVVTVLEERELLDRFGAAYAEYRSRVPRLMPRP